jgi:hypothetical protein
MGNYGFIDEKGHKLHRVFEITALKSKKKFKIKVDKENQ